jgi:hypothetical protein
MKKLIYSLDQNSLSVCENGSDYVDVLALAANVAKTFTKPVGARFCRLSAGTLFYYRINGVATVTAIDIVNGAGSISVPATVQPMFCVDDITIVSVISTGSAVISAEWWA